jgi:acyl carrier protein
MREVRNKLSQREQLTPEAFVNRYFPQEKRTVAERLLALTLRLSRADLTGLLPEDRFVEDFRMDELDSMSLLELTLDIEKDFKIEISDKSAQSIQTFAQLVDAVYQLQNGPSFPV